MLSMVMIIHISYWRKIWMVHILFMIICNLLVQSSLSSCDILVLFLHLMLIHAIFTKNLHSACLSMILLFATIHYLLMHFLRSVPTMLSLLQDCYLNLMDPCSMLVILLSNTSSISNLPFLILCMLLFSQNLDFHWTPVQSIPSKNLCTFYKLF